MSLTWMQLRYPGAKKVRPYNGGWSHWGNRLPPPAVEGEKPCAGDYGL